LDVSTLGDDDYAISSVVLDHPADEELRLPVHVVGTGVDEVSPAVEVVPQCRLVLGITFSYAVAAES
jgi:hypothetical protein